MPIPAGVPDPPRRPGGRAPTRPRRDPV